jgi:hypothetical protein
MLQAASSAGDLPPGEFLIGGRPTVASRSRVELQFDLTQLLRKVRS